MHHDRTAELYGDQCQGHKRPGCRKKAHHINRLRNGTTMAVAFLVGGQTRAGRRYNPSPNGVVIVLQGEKQKSPSYRTQDGSSGTLYSSIMAIISRRNSFLHEMGTFP